MYVDWLILADSAQVVGNKLFLLGGGWRFLTAQNGYPFQQHFAVAVGMQLQWAETNMRHPFTLEITDEDGKQLYALNGEIEAGRPVGAPPGEQLVQIAIDITMSFERAGTYAVIARLGADEEQQTFHVIDPQPA